VIAIRRLGRDEAYAHRAAVHTYETKLRPATSRASHPRQNREFASSTARTSQDMNATATFNAAVLPDDRAQGRVVNKAALQSAPDDMLGTRYLMIGRLAQAGLCILPRARDCVREAA